MRQSTPEDDISRSPLGRRFEIPSPNRLAAFTCLPLLFPAIAMALDASEVFERADPGVVAVLAADARGEKSNLGSGVIISPVEILTSCKVVESAVDIVVSQDSALRKATLRFRDAERDLCQLHIEDPLPAGKPVTIAPSPIPMKTGQELYAIGAPRGMEHTIIRAMVSGLRETSTSTARLLQIDVALAGGSTGSGVFDQSGRLVGIAAGRFKQGDSATYAVPIDWLAVQSEPGCHFERPDFRTGILHARAVGMKEFIATLPGRAKRL